MRNDWGKSRTRELTLADILPYFVVAGVVLAALLRL